MAPSGWLADVLGDCQFVVSLLGLVLSAGEVLAALACCLDELVRQLLGEAVVFEQLAGGEADGQGVGFDVDGIGCREVGIEEDRTSDGSKYGGGAAAGEEGGQQKQGDCEGSSVECRLGCLPVVCARGESGCSCPGRWGADSVLSSMGCWC